MERVDHGDEVALAAAVSRARADVVLHLGGKTTISPGSPGDAREVMMRLNATATGIVCEAAASSGVQRVVYTSSAAVYGDKHRVPTKESATLHPESPYAESKARAEGILADSGVETVSLRVFNVYGPGFDDSLVARLLRSTAEEPALLRGLDTFVRDYVHVGDVVSALLASTRAPMPSAHATINIGSGVPTSNRALIGALGDHALYYRVASELASFSCADIGLAGAVLGFEPRTAIEADDTGGLAP